MHLKTEEFKNVIAYIKPTDLVQQLFFTKNVTLDGKVAWACLSLLILFMNTSLIMAERGKVRYVYVDYAYKFSYRILCENSSQSIKYFSSFAATNVRMLKFYSHFSLSFIEFLRNGAPRHRIILYKLKNS